ncbi:ArnT family glycosyltransferase [Desulfohalovibrio reitneri]|uniref:ArnT family glycosyltransferase n=1 Tax=Desulfohalovibrio reitneri TaxID=1307759 RepID=UPI0004A6E8E7|nr:glycosyltransferase family 39 protein [Desulfohalovibrio reitneri]
MSASNRTRWDIVAACIILVSVAAKLWVVATGQLNLVQDEAQYWDWTRQLQWSYYSKGPLIAWIIHLGTSIFGDTELGVRIGAIVGSGLTQAVIYLGVARLWSMPRTAVWTLVIANTAPMFMASGILMTTDNPLVLCWAGSIFCLDAATRPETSARWRKAAFLGMGVLVAFGILAKYMMLAFPPLALAYCGWLWWRGRLPEGFWKPCLLALAAGTALGFLPILIWNAQNDWVGFRHVSHLAGVDKESFFRLDRFPDYFGSQVGLMTPWWFIFLLWGGWRALKQATGRGEGLLPDRDRAGLLAIFFWPMWIFFIFWSFHTKIQPNWSAVSYVAGIMLTGFLFDRFFHASASRWRKVWPALGLAIFLIAHFQSVLPLPAHLNPAHRLKGWDDLGLEVEEMRLTRFPNPDKVFIFSEQYDMTSALAFYVPGQPRTYCAWIDRRMNQYDIWAGPQDKVGWDAVYVRKYFKGDTDQGVREMFDRVEGPIHFQSTFQGESARKYTIFLCYDFNGHWPQQEGQY